jgi:hypothetical protein
MVRSLTCGKTRNIPGTNTATRENKFIRKNAGFISQNPKKKKSGPVPG